MAWTIDNFTGYVNTLINQALAGGLTAAQITTVLNNAATATSSLAVTHDRTIEDPGPDLDPSQP